MKKRNRLKEPSTWAGLAALCVAAAGDFPEAAGVFKGLALFFGSGAVVLREGPEHG
jgi:hypothetical protein